MAEKILIVDDEPNIRDLVRFNLEKAGYITSDAQDGVAALDAVRQERPDLIILDLMIPGKDGLEVCRLLKSQRKTSGIAIIMLTAKTEEIDKILGLEMGADDYITKPFSTRELLARVKAVLRRGQKETSLGGELVIGPLKFDFASYEAYIGKEKLELTPKE